MQNNLNRRTLIRSSVPITFAAVTAHAMAQTELSKPTLLGICCSPRKGMTTSAALSVALNAAKEYSAAIDTELIELADYNIPAQLAAGQPLRKGEQDDFPKLVDRIGRSSVAGIIIGSPVYFGNMSALCKSFLDRCMVFRQDRFKLRNKVGGVLAVGGARNGGQELTIRSIQTALFTQDMILVGDGQPTARIGATFWSQNNQIEDDGFGLDTAKNLGARVAELAMLLTNANQHE